MDIWSKLINICSGIEARPSMYIPKMSYEKLASYLDGYIVCMEDLTSVPVTSRLNTWMSNHYKRNSSLVWYAYVYYLLADEDESIAIKKLLASLKEFSEDMINEGL